MNKEIEINKEIERLKILGIILERRFRIELPPIYYLVGRGSGKPYMDFKRFCSEVLYGGL